MRVAFQGEIGAFSEEAAKALFGDVALAPRADFDGVFDAVTSGEADRGVIPIENSLFGSVHANYDLLRANDLFIVAEIQLRIRHNLLVLPGASAGALRRIYSHPQALGQCQAYIKSAHPDAEIVPAYDTAGAAKLVAASRDAYAAAIASEQAAQEYGLSIAVAGIESNQENYTRFLALARSATPEPPEEARGFKTSVVFSLKENVPGALFKSLAVFALREIDLYKIESRPLVGSPGQYLFYIDFAGRTTSEPVQRALEHLAELAEFVKTLGSYPSGTVLE